MSAVRTELTDDWLAMLQERAAKSPGLDSEWALRLAQLAVGRDLDAEKISSELPADLRRLMLSFVNLAGTVRRIAQNPQYVDERALDRVEDLRAILLEHAEPKVSSIALCRKVVGYGVFDSLPEEELLQGVRFGCWSTARSTGYARKKRRKGCTARSCRPGSNF